MGQHWQQTQQSQDTLSQASHNTTSNDGPSGAPRKESEAQAIDIVTGLESRECYLRHLLSLNKPVAESGQIAIVILDLDHFRIINHSLGVSAGDQILASVGKRIRNTINRETDRAFRVAGNEFAIVTTLPSETCPQKEPEDQAYKYAITLAEVITKPHTVLAGLDGKNRDVIHRGGVSVGVALLGTTPRDGLTAHDKATMAMREAKRAGGGRIQLFSNDFSQDFRLRRQMETALREAVKNQSLSVVYQAQVDENGNPRSAEALLRWTCPALGTISPGTFIKLGEELGLISEIGEFVIETACRQVVRWSQMPPPLNGLTVAVNVSALQLYDANLDQTVARILQQTGADPRKLKFEITESVLMENLGHVREVLYALRNMGIGVALDDFGTGYTSFEYLRNLPITEIKIDRSFIRHIETEVHDKIIAKTILDLGDAMGVDVVAEGFENEAQVEMLRKMGCRRFQGFHFARPLPKHDFEHFISNYRALCDF